ncbi:MAG: hypothetical protein ABSE50_18575, partial [Xanthobacteraceae bacterium]
MTATITSSAVSQPVLAATEEQIMQSCLQALMPQIMACAQAKGLRGNPEAVKQQCGRGQVRACVIREEQKQAGGKAAPAAPKSDADVVPAGASPVQPVFVAPPRTIADITAILDSEKPDETKIAKYKAEADATPASNLSGEQLARFYYDRGSARAILARNQDTIADCLEALKTAKDIALVTRIRQLLAQQYRTTGDPRQAVALYQMTVREADQPGKRGAMINALVDIAETLFNMG